jgi:hypothetical protein
MRFNLTIILLISLISFSAFAQKKSSISGKVIDEKNAEPLTGAIVKVAGTSIGAIVDLNGDFIIKDIAVGNYTIECSYVSYNTKSIADVIVKENEVTNLTINLQKVSKNLKVITIKSTLKKESNASLLAIQKNSTSVSDGVSAELIKRTPDKNTSDVLKRVSGASIQDNKFAIIRGLNDRYNAALLNGAPLPSSEPDRKAFAFDIFPASMLDNLVITKTATPDMPAEFAGGIIQINTKDVPDKNFYTLSVSSGYNTITTGETKLYAKGSSTDWLGIDDGMRAIPSKIPSQENFPIKILTQAQLAELTSFDWNIKNDAKFSPNLSLQYSMGVVKPIHKKTLAFVLALTYNSTKVYNETVRKSYDGADTSYLPSLIQNEYLDKLYSVQTLAGALANLSLKLNKNNSISVKNLFSINSDNRITNRTGTNDASQENPILINANNRFFISNKIYTGQLNGEHYQPNSRIRISWLASLSAIDRNIPNERRTIYSRNKYIVNPEYPNTTDTTWQANISQSTVGPDYGGGMFWSKNKENVKSGKINLSRSFDVSKDFKNEIKIGFFTQQRSRNFYSRRLGYTRYGGGASSVKFKDSLLFLPENEIFAPENMGRLEMVGNVTTKGGFKLSDATKPSDSYIASSQLNAYFFMLDNRYKFLRLIWGMRYENYHLLFDAKRSVNKDEDVHLKIVQNDALPSANLVVAINKNQNLRLAYSQTLNRPEYRELAPFLFYDFNSKFTITGKDSLKRAKIHNADIRYEIYPGRGQLFSVSGFYKKFIDPIEQILTAYSSNDITYNNLSEAKNYGAELEFRVLLASLFHKDSIKILNDITAFSNLAIIRSTVNTANISGAGSASRPLQGQSPYVFNAGMQYINEKNALSASVSFNRVGSRIYIVGNENDAAIWEAPRSFLDFQFAKSLNKNKIELKFNIQNALAQKQIFYQNKLNIDAENKNGFNSTVNKIFSGDARNKLDYNKKVDDLIWSTNFGIVYSLSIAIKL